MARRLTSSGLLPLAAAVGISLVANLALLGAAIHLAGRTARGILNLIAAGSGGHG